MVYPQGGAGNVYVGGGFAHSRRATLNVTVATFNTDVLAIQNGTEVSTGSTDITYYDVIEAKEESGSKKYYTKFKATGTADSEIKFVYIVGADGTYSKEYTQDSTASAGKFTYDSSTKEIKFETSDAPAAGDIIACAYTFKSATNAQTIHVAADGIPPVVLATAYGIAKDVCTGELFPCEIEGQAQVDGNWNFDLSADGEPVAQNLTLEFVKGCLNNTLYTFKVYTEDEAGT